MLYLGTYYLFIIFFLGAIIGSFLNVIIYRLHTGRSLQGRSHCLSCNEQLRWYELIPLVSYIVLRARCRTCASFIPARYLIVELLTAGGFLLIGYLFMSDPLLLFLNLVLYALLVVVVVYDMYHTIIPDEYVAYISIVALAMLTHAYFFMGATVGALFMSLAGGVAAASFFALFWLVSKGKWMGLGDAKLMLPLGVILGATGSFSAVVLSFWIGAAISVSLIGIQRLLAAGKTRIPFVRVPLTIKSEVPFAPFLVLGFFAVHLFHVDIFTLVSIIFRI